MSTFRLTFRFLASAGLFLFASVSTGFAENGIQYRLPSATGNFLAGSEAMKNLDTKSATALLLDAAKASWDNPAVVGRAFDALLADGRVDNAADFAQHLLELDKNNEMAHLVLAVVALKERRYDSVSKQLSAVQPVSLVGITAAIMHAWALVGIDAYDLSQKMLDEVARQGLADFLVFHRALMADVADRHADALTYITEAHKSQPYVARIAEAYIRIQADATNFDEARKAMANYEDQGLDYPLVLQLKTDIAAGKRPGKLAATAQSGAAEMFHGIGTALAADGSSELADQMLQLGLYLNPQSDVIKVARADLLEKLGRYTDANQIYQGLIVRSPLGPDAAVRFAQNLDAMGQREDAIRRLQNIVATQPDNLLAIGALGDLLRYSERYPEAISAYGKAIALVGGTHPRDWRFFYVRGISYERTDQWPLAETDFLKALDLNPGQPQVLNYLGYSWVDKGMNLDRALGMIQKAIEWDPTDGYVVDSLGWAYYRLGRYDEAVQTLEQALQLRPNDPEINDHLGDAYWRTNRKLEARFQWNIAIAMDDKGNVKKRVDPKLKDGLPPVDGG